MIHSSRISWHEDARADTGRWRSKTRQLIAGYTPSSRGAIDRAYFHAPITGDNLY